MNDGDQSSVYLDNNFKPPDRSTSAPPVLSLHPDSLFAFRAAEHLQLFSDIRCEDNYYEFYSKYQTQGGKGLPPPLENQSFLNDRSYGEEDEHLINSLPNSTNPHASSHQQQIQQLQQQIQQQQHQIQQQQALQQHLQLQQQYMQQQHPQQQHPQQQTHSPHHNSHQMHPHQPQQQQHIQHSQHSQHSHSQHPQHLHQHQQQSHHAHPQSMQHQMHPHHQNQPQQPQQQPMHQPFQQMHVQPHMRAQERSYSVPDARNPILPRSTSNPSYSMRNFDTVQEEPSRIDDLSDPNRTIWTPHPRSMVVGLNDYMDSPDDGMQQHNKGRHPHNMPHHRTPPLPQQAPQSRDPNRDPNNYYNNEDFDNVALRTAHNLLNEDNLSTQIGRSIWNDRGFDTRAPQSQANKHSPHITAPTPTVPSSHSAIMDLLSNGLFPPAPTADSMLRGGVNPRRRSHSGGVSSIPPPTTSPPLLNSGSASTSPALPICRYYAQGFCSRGERCNFLHDEQSQQMLNASQQGAGNEQFTVTKPKAKKTVASPPPISMQNLPPKVPSPVNNNLRMGPGGSGNGHHANGLGNGVPASNSGANTPNNNATLSSIINSLSTMNLDVRNPRDGPGGGRSLSPSSMLGLSDIIGGNGGSTSPQPRSTTPNSGGLADVFANGGSTSPNGKSDLTRQYTSIEQVIGHIYSLCKDQHGCRFLQKKLEDRDTMIVEIIFNEVYDHMTELMIDPFGNYLCQKLLEHCNDDQRLDIIEKVAPDLVKISKNMHGTRAVQKMIEYLTTPEQVGGTRAEGEKDTKRGRQIAIAKKALSNHVVTLIQDLNGNHVIQRCLNRLSPQDNQFIYDSVSQAGHCVEVATHRHGCCVLQRCIDHASDSQKIQLINEIIANALVLVQDPYGNYVVQYVLDLPFPGLASRLARRFLGHIPILSTQKFSSNVVEKCLNVTDIQTRAAIIQELVEYDNLLYLLQDPYANYVIQTSLNVSEPVQHARLVEAIRPHLTSLRNTPYGKRIQNKILKESSRDYYASAEFGALQS